MIPVEQRSRELQRYYDNGRNGRDAAVHFCAECGELVSTGCFKRCPRCAARHKNREKHLRLSPAENYASVRKWQKSHPDKFYAQQMRRRAAKAQVANTLTLDEWAQVQADYMGTCVYCGGVADTMDHIVPIAAGGGHTAENVVPACRRCNSKKGMMPVLFFMYRRRRAWQKGR